MTQSKDAGPGSLVFNSKEITEALNKHLAVFKSHQLTVLEATMDMENLEKLFKGNGIGLRFSYKCKESKACPRDDEAENSELLWARYGSSFRLLYTTSPVYSESDDTANWKPAAEAPSGLRLRLHRVLPDFVEAFAQFVKKGGFARVPLDNMTLDSIYEARMAAAQQALDRSEEGRRAVPSQKN